MAPEQAGDGVVGFAADQYALGVVMCEMLTGQLPMRPVEDGQTQLPNFHFDPRWEPVIKRCLKFKPEDRFSDIRDVTAALSPQSHAKSGRIAIVGTVLFLTLVGIALVKIGVKRQQVEAISQLTPDTDLTSRPSLSRDAQFIAYSSDRAEAGNLDIWIQRLPSGRPIRLTTNPSQDVDPNIAPDGSSVVFRSERNGGGIYIVSAMGTGERMLAPNGRNPRFSPDGKSVLYWTGDPDDSVASGMLYVLSIANGFSVRLAADFKDARLPVWSSDGQYVLFTGCRTVEQPPPACAEWWVTSRDGAKVENTGGLRLLRSQQIEPIEEVGNWYGDEVIFSGRHRGVTSLWESALPRRKLKADGKAVQLTSGDAREVAPSVADNNKIAFEHLTGAVHVWRIASLSDPRRTSATKLTQDALFDLSPSITKNGHWLVFSRGIGSPRDIWIKDTISGNEALFFGSPEDKLFPIADDSGKTVVFEERTGAISSLFVVTDGRAPVQLCSSCGRPTGWFLDNRSVFFSKGVPSEIKTVDIATLESTTVLENPAYSLGDASWSSEVEHLLFTASRGTSKRVFMASLPRTATSVTGEWIPISDESESSDRPLWSNDGKSVFYLSNRDGYSCIWGRHIEFAPRTFVSPPFVVMHYHNPRFSPGVVANRSFNMSVSGDSIYLNVGEINTSIWIGTLRNEGSLLSWK